jgi:CHAT domain-containing protein/tetratricopeptide (TPR) repeat protein
MRLFVRACVLTLAFVVLASGSGYRSAVLVVPLQTGAGISASEGSLGVGLEIVLENTLAAQGSLEEVWAEDEYPRFFKSATEYRPLLSSASAMPLSGHIPARYVAGGSVSREGNQVVASLAVHDRQTGKDFRVRVPLDFPQLRELRLSFLGLLQSAGIFSVERDGSKLWAEDLTPDCLNALGAGVSEAAKQLLADDADITVPRTLTAAAAACPKSYVVQASLAWQQTKADADGNGVDAGSAAMELNRLGTRAFEWLVEAAFGTFQPKSAKKGVDSVMSARGGQSAFDQARFNYWTGRMEFLGGDLDEAERLLRESIRLNPDALDPRLELAKVANRRNHMLVDGEAVLNEAGKQFTDPDEQRRIEAANKEMGQLSLGDVAFLQAMEMEAQGNWQEAEEFYGIAAKVHRGGDLADSAVDLISTAELEEAHRQADQAKAHRAQAQELISALPSERPMANSLAYRAMHMVQQGNLEKAPTALKDALTRCYKAKDAKCEFEVLNYAGLRYVELGFVVQGVDYLEQAVQAQDSLHDAKVTGIAENNLGIGYRAAGRLADALEAFNKAYEQRVKAGDKDGLRRTVQNLSVVYGDMGRQDRAVAESRRALAMARENSDQHGQIVALYTLGSYLTKLGDQASLREAVPILEQAISLSRETKDRHEEGIALNNLATAKSYRGEDGRALLEQSLEIARSERNWHDQLVRLANFGTLMVEQGKKTDAERDFKDSLAIADGTGSEVEEARTLARLMIVSADRPRLAFWYGKQAAEIIARKGPTLYLGSETEGSSFGDFFERLSGMLVQQGSLAEARHVLDVQKISEQARTGAAGSIRQVALLTPDESAAAREYRRLVRLWFALEEERTNPAATPDPAVVAREGAARKKVDDYLGDLEKQYGQETASRVKADVAPSSTGSLAGKAVIHTVPGDRYRAIITTERGSVLIEGNLETRVLNQKIFAFRQALSDPASDPKPLAQELYREIFLPLKKSLDDARATTLYWSLEGALRYLPMAALHDGDDYLVTRYRNVSYSPIAKSGARSNSGVKTIFAGGVSNAYQKLGRLPFVEDELGAIVKSDDSAGGVLSGMKRLNGDFTWEDLQAQLGKGFSVVHLATHFTFRPENPGGSELLFGTGPMRLDRIAAAQDLFRNVDLVVLSGCETGSPGSADAGEVDALSGAMLSLGARSAVASLWQVADRSTPELMANFYRAYADKGDAAEALQAAQTGMLRGNASHRHPYYWAPFFLSASN